MNVFLDYGQDNSSYIITQGTGKSAKFLGTVRCSSKRAPEIGNQFPIVFDDAIEPIKSHSIGRVNNESSIPRTTLEYARAYTKTQICSGIHTFVDLTLRQKPSQLETQKVS